MTNTSPASPPAAAPPRPHLTLKPGGRWAALNLPEVWHFRDLLLTLAGRDVKLRYRQTALGAAWVVLQPLIAAGIFSFTFSTVAHLPTDGVPPFPFAFAGLLAWNAFNSTLNKSSGSLVSNAALVSKVFFPRLVLPLSTVFSTLIDFGVALVVLFLLMALYHLPLFAGMVLLPVWLLLLLLLAVGVGLAASALAVSYRDVGFIVPVLTQFLFIASPVGYAAAAVPGHLRAIYFLNPVAGLLEAFKWSVFGHGHVPWGSVAYSAAFGVAAFVGGAFAFKSMERRFADVI